MKTTILAAAAILTLGIGSAFAGDGPGGTAVQAQSDLMNGVQSNVATQVRWPAGDSRGMAAGQG